MVNGGITKDSLGLILKDNSVLCVQCGKWIHAR